MYRMGNMIGVYCIISWNKEGDGIVSWTIIVDLSSSQLRLCRAIEALSLKPEKRVKCYTSKSSQRKRQAARLKIVPFSRDQAQYCNALNVNAIDCVLPHRARVQCSSAVCAVACPPVHLPVFHDARRERYIRMRGAYFFPFPTLLDDLVFAMIGGGNAEGGTKSSNLSGMGVASAHSEYVEVCRGLTKSSAKSRTRSFWGDCAMVGQDDLAPSLAQQDRPRTACSQSRA